MKNYITEIETGGLNPKTKSFTLVRKAKSMFFAQFKVEDEWFFTVNPIGEHNGHNTIEDCQTMIDHMEQLDQALGLGLIEYRIKEELI